MIRFGTAGWRGIIGDEFTFHNVRLVSQAIANHLKATDGNAPGPTISFSILEHGACGALKFTASHNQPEYNGLKFHDASGATALPEITASIERHLRQIESTFSDDLLATRLQDPPARFGGEQVESVTRRDGIKLELHDAWFLYRRSGTENVLRCYAEAPTDDRVQALHAAGRALLLNHPDC